MVGERPCSADSLRKKLIWCATQQGLWNLRGLGEQTSRLVDKPRKGGEMVGHLSPKATSYDLCSLRPLFFFFLIFCSSSITSLSILFVFFSFYQIGRVDKKNKKKGYWGGVGMD